MQNKKARAILETSGLALAALLATTGVSAAPVTASLEARATTVVLPDGQSVPMWGLFCAVNSNRNPATGATCTALATDPTDGLHRAQTTTWQPPLIIANAHDSLTINLTNSLPAAVPTSLVIVGQLGGGLGTDRKTTPSPVHPHQGTTWPGTQGDPDPGGACGGESGTFCPPDQGVRVQSFASEAAHGATVALTWNDLKAGTYLIESGTHPSIQGPMGLYGVLVVNAAPGTAYDGVSYSADVPLLLSEIDPAQNAEVTLAIANAGNEAGFENRVWNGQKDQCGDTHTCYPPAVNYDPRYYLINGVSFDSSSDTNRAKSVFSVAPANVTGQMLVRFVNAGLRMHAPSIVGALTGNAGVSGFSLIAEDGNRLPGTPRIQSDVLLPAGKTYDVLMTAAGTSVFPIFDRQLSLSTNNQRDGGMHAYISVNGGVLASASAAAHANPDSYFLVPGTNLSVQDRTKGVLANDIGVSGATVLTGPTGTNSTLALNSNGTFTYSPGAGVASDSFTYCANGTVDSGVCSSGMTATVTLAACTGTCLADAPVATNITFTSKISSRFTSSPPGVLAGVSTNTSGLELTATTTAGASIVTLNANGSFVAQGPGVACGGAISAPPGATCTTFPYQAKTTQGSVSNIAVATVIFLPASNLTVNVKDAKTGDAIEDYRWIIEEDRTVFIDPKIETTSATSTPRNLGVNFHTSHMPVVAQGCTGQFSCEVGQQMLDPATGEHVPAVCDVGNGACRPDPAGHKAPVNPGEVALDPAKRYYISILPGDAADDTDAGPAHGMGGAQIAAGQRSVDVSVQPLPYPSAKISVFVFQDDFPLNGENDTGGGVDVLAPNEPGLEGFNIVLLDQTGQFGDPAGQLTYDEFGMPVSNSLAHTIDPATGLDACPISPSSADGIVGMIVTCPKFESDGTTLSPLRGHAVIANMYPGLYEVHTTPGADRTARGEEWLQTNTLDGTKDIEAFIKPDEPSYFQEFGPGGYHVAVGFANPKLINDRLSVNCSAAGANCTGRFFGHVTSMRMSRTPDQRVYGSGTYDAYSFGNCYVSLGAPDGEDFAFTKCDADGKFEFNNIPTGDLRVTVFDQWNDLLVDGLSTPVKSATSGPGTSDASRVEIPVTQWRTNLYGRIFLDQNGDNVSQEEEPGLPLVPYNIRYRDGSYMGFNNTDLAGNAGFNEVFPFLNWLVIDTDSARYKQTGVHVVYDAGGQVDGAAGGGTSSIAAGLANTIESPKAHLPAELRIPGAKYCKSADCDDGTFDPGTGTTAGSTGRVDPGWVPSEGWQGLLGQNSFAEFAMRQFEKNENGGIKGHVIYTSTRPFDDPALLLQLSWEPGVPNVKINLYQEGTGPDGTKSLTLVDTTTTTSWDDWAQGFRRNPDGTLVNVGTAASPRYVPNMSCPGQDTTSPFYFTMLGGTQALNPDKPMAADGRFRCYDGWSMLNQVQPAPYNGMYKFPSVRAKGATGEFLELDPTPADRGGPGYGTNCTICSPSPVDGTPMLPSGKYVVEIVMPDGYELVKEEDKNILLGDVYIAPVEQQFAGFGAIFIMPDQAAVNAYYNRNNGLQSTTNNNASPRHEGDTGSVEVFWPCVGANRIVPDFNSLFPGAEQAAPFAGATRPLCDRKEVVLEDQMTALAKFYVFTSAHVAGHYTGTITNDFASEFDPFSPQFGEKFAVPNAPVAFRDFTGKEVGRVYADQWGDFNGLNYSTWTVNPPSPSGYIPQMMIACMNDPGPIPDPSGATDSQGNPLMITDPAYNPAYSNFCYETPFMPGQTAYMDTPVIPTMAFADGYNLPDCEYPDTTPAIKKVVGDGGLGPWTAGADGTRAVTALSPSSTAITATYSRVPIIGFTGGGAGSSSAGADANMHISSLTLTNRGVGFTGRPTVTFAGGAPTTNATATATMRVGSIALDDSGSGYTSRPAVTLSGGGGSGASVTTNNVTLKVVSVRVNNGGSCSTGNHNVSFSGGGGNASGGGSAAGTAVITGGTVTAVNITDDGGSYTGVPTVNVAGCNESVTAVMGVRAITLAGNGSGYISQPTVHVAAPPGVGNQTAAATAFLNVSSLALNSGGSGYSKTPTVMFTGAGGSGASASFSLQFDTTNRLEITAGGGYTSATVPTVTFTPSCSSNPSVVCATATLGATTNAHTLTITALGNKQVLNHAYAGPQATDAPYNEKMITRHYGFGSAPATCPTGPGVPCPNVTVGGVPLTNVTWSDTSISGSVPNGVPACAVQPRGVTGTLCGELEITTANGKKSIDTVMVTIGGKKPTYVTPSSLSASTFGHSEPNPLQTAIDNADPGELIIVGEGSYRENLLMWKPVRLQGVGAEGVIINADAHPAGKMEGWRRQLNCLFGLALNGQPITDDNPYDATGSYSCPDSMRQHVDRIPFEGILGWDTTVNGNLAQMLQEPTLMGAYEGAGVTMLGKGVWMSAGTSVADQFGAAAAGGFPADYRYLTASTSGNNGDCAIPAAGTPFWREYYTTNFLCNPSRVDGISVINSSQGGGAIFAHGWNHNLEVANTRVHGNHGTLTGGITIGTGEFPDPFIIGGDAAVPVGLPDTGLRPGQTSLAAGQQTGYGFNRNVKVHNNSVTSNLSVGDALYSATPSAAGGVTFCVGADGYKFNNNWICGNMSTGDAGGVAHAGFINDGTIARNTIIFNQSQSPTIPTNGGGLGILGAAPDRSFIENGVLVECGSTSDADCPPGLAEGTGRNLVIDSNLIMGNSAESGTGGGLRLQLVNGQDVQAFPTAADRWNDVTVTNNIIGNNVAGWDGGGVSMQDALKVKFVNNTVISNDTTASAGVLFNTLGAPLASVPGPNCHLDPTPTDPNHFTCDAVLGSTNQVAGLVTMQNTPNLIASSAGVSCPTEYGYTATSCRQVSLPILTNNLFWRNRTFHIDVADLVAGQQQAVVTLLPTLNQTSTGMCASSTNDPGNYWDIGVRGDTGPTNHAAFKLQPAFSILTGGDYAGSGNKLGSDPGVIRQYCNGARIPPEHCSGITDSQELLRCKGYNVPPGHSESTGLYPVFTANAIVPAATVDEGNNWINLGYGPLSLNNAATYTAPGTALPLLGDYSITPASAAASVATNAGAPDHDFFGNPRPDTVNHCVDIGAVEVAGTGPCGGSGGGGGIPTLGVLDDFNRLNANTLNNGTNWQQLVSGGSSGIRINDLTTGNASTGTALCSTSGLLCALGANAYWNATAFGTKQAAAFTFGTGPLFESSLVLKAGGTFQALGYYPNAIRVRYTTAAGPDRVVVETTTNGVLFTQRGTAMNATFAVGDKLTALVDAAGLVTVWQTTAANVTTQLGTVQLPITGTNSFTIGSGRIGMFLPPGGRVDNFSGGNVP